MTFEIPSEVLSKYTEAADAMLSTSGFGTPCKIIYVDKISTTETNLSGFRNRNSMHPSGGGGSFSRGGQSYKTVEVSESITLRVYWDQKDFKKFGNVQVPDGAIMTIGKYSDLGKIQKATALVIDSERTNHAEWRFEKKSEPTIHGLTQNYFMCVWTRA